MKPSRRKTEPLIFVELALSAGTSVVSPTVGGPTLCFGTGANGDMDSTLVLLGILIDVSCDSVASAPPADRVLLPQWPPLHIKSSSIFAPIRFTAPSAWNPSRRKIL